MLLEGTQSIYARGVSSSPVDAVHRWGLLAVADKENMCDGCQADADGAGACTCEVPVHAVQKPSAIKLLSFLPERFSGTLG